MLDTGVTLNVARQSLILSGHDDQRMTGEGKKALYEWLTINESGNVDGEDKRM